jgi:hypothetical protein
VPAENDVGMGGRNRRIENRAQERASVGHRVGPGKSMIRKSVK